MNQPEEQIWTDTIDSKRGLLDMDIKEVWSYHDLLFMLVKKRLCYLLQTNDLKTDLVFIFLI